MKPRSHVVALGSALLLAVLASCAADSATNGGDGIAGAGGAPLGEAAQAVSAACSGGVCTSATVNLLIQRPNPGSTPAAVFDTGLNQATPTTPSGTSQTMPVGTLSGTLRDALIRFDLGAIPSGAGLTALNAQGLTVSTGYITLFEGPLVQQAPNGLGTINLHQVTSAWIEAGATWSTMPSYDATALVSFSNGYSASNTYPHVLPSINIPTLIQGWAQGSYPNYGVLLEESPDANHTTFVTSEYGTVSVRPSLTVLYTLTCTTSFADCNNNGSDGCEANLTTSVANCGTCGHACVVAHATPACVAGACAVGSCNLGYGDCDGSVANGCETLLTTNQSCGGCGVACALANATSSCATGSCALVSCNAGHYDCDGNVANGCEANSCASGQHCNTDAACQSDVCANGFCAAPICTDGVQNGTETAVDCGGGACPPCSPGKTCSLASDCASDVCTGGLCQAPSCTDGAHNGGETGADCGGGACPACGTGGGCDLGSDCTSGVCTAHLCQAPACNDGVKNGTESAVDCGGASCPPCADGKSCLAGSDCVDKVCSSSVCQIPSCTDGVENGSETDVDCGGTCPPCVNNDPCNVNADCAGGFCSSGVCTPIVCSTTTCGVGVCQSQVTNCNNAATQPCVPGQPTSPQDLCDGLDESCDGVVNGGCQCIDGHTQACYTGAPGTLGVGVCQAGVQTCAHGLWGNCIGETTPTAETCDGLDNDCDGLVDDGLGSTTCGVGECQVTTPNCVNGLAQTCTPRPPGVEVCNGLDDDCDGLVDDNLPTLTCGVGACMNSVDSCADGMAVTCVPGQPSPEICNGIDDDCNGLVDDGNPGGGLACSTGNQGVCAAGTTSCVSGSIACGQNVQPSPEVCNGLDDNCDGHADEGDPGGGVACNTGLLGVCAAGTTHCQSGHLVCVQNVQPSPETCDGLDNNCNGQVDEGLGSTTCGGAGCQVTVQNCVGGVTQVCNAATVNGQPCNDGNACTAPDRCEGGACTSTSVSAGTSCGTGAVCDGSGSCVGGCYVGGTLYTSGQKDGTGCGVCAPAISTTALQAVAVGTSCGSGQICTGALSTCAADCYVSGMLYTSGQVDGTGCGVCAPATSTKALQAVARGTSCGAGQICTGAVSTCASRCYIGGVLYTAGTRESAAGTGDNNCAVCTPSTSTSAWSAVAAGTTGCGTKEICTGAVGVCAADCYVGGTLYTAGHTNAAGCGVCTPATSTAALQPVAVGTSCGGGRICTGTVNACAADCYVDGTLYTSGQVDDTGCGVCTPATSTAALQPVAAGMSCGSGQICTGAVSTCAADCYVSSTLYTAGQTDGTGCGVCMPATSTTALQAVGVGTSCGSGQICTGALSACAASCYIGGTLYTSGQVDDTGCGVCTPATSTTALQAVGVGTSCGSGQICTGAVSTCAADCYVSSTLYTVGQTDGTGCGVCTPATSTTALQAVAKGTSCGSGQICTGVVSTCAADCYIGGTLYTAGQTDGTGCGVCTPAASTTTLQAVAKGTSCGAGLICTGNVSACASRCYIGGVLYTAGTRESAAGTGDDNCAVCTPSTSTTAWSAVAAGTTGCGTREICTGAVGVCAADCYVGGTLYTSGQVDGTGCGVCTPATSTKALQPVAAGTSCGSGQICTGAVSTCAADCYVGGTLYTSGEADGSACWVCIPASSTSALQGLCAGAVQISAGEGGTLTLATDGTVWSTGDNPGDGTTNDYTTPAQVSALSGITWVAEGIGSNDMDDALAVGSDGTVWAWGRNDSGQLGDGTTTDQASPVQVVGLSGVTAVSAGLSSFSLALKSDGTVWSWGWNNSGQLGNGGGPDQYAPVQITGLSSVTAVAAGSLDGLAIRSDGTVWSWGFDGQYGNLGLGYFAGDTIPPTQVLLPPGVFTAVASGSGFAYALRSDGTVWAWGSNGHGELGNGTSDQDGHPTPMQVLGLSGVTAVAAGGVDFGLALRSDGTVWTWGNNDNGQLGQGNHGPATYLFTPTQVPGLSGVVAVNAGRYDAYALTSDGTVWTWGANYYGEGGLGTTGEHDSPVQSLLP